MNDNAFTQVEDAGGMSVGGREENPGKVFLTEPDVFGENLIQAGKVASLDDLHNVAITCLTAFKYGDHSLGLEMLYFVEATRGANGEANELAVAAIIGDFRRKLSRSDTSKGRGWFGRKKDNPERFEAGSD